VLPFTSISLFIVDVWNILVNLYDYVVMGAEG